MRKVMNLFHELPQGRGYVSQMDRVTVLAVRISCQARVPAQSYLQLQQCLMCRCSPSLRIQATLADSTPITA